MHFRNDINSLRAIAVIIVVLFHFKVVGFAGGFIGVDVFFVISGYLMSAIILSKLRQDNFSLFDFYLSRARRIVPALSVMCIATLIAGFLLLSPNDYELLGKHAYSSLLFVSNFIYARDAGYFAAASESKWLLHTWSLSVEWQFYLAFPLMLMLLKRVSTSKLRGGIAVLALSSYALSIYLSPLNSANAFFMLTTRAWEMLIGTLIFLYPMQSTQRTRQYLELLGLVLIVLSVVCFTKDTLWPSYFAMLPVLGAVCIIAAANQASVISHNAVLAWLGKTSYSIYLWHWPIVATIYYFELIDNIYVVTLGILFSLILGWLSFKYIEVPLTKRHKNKSNSKEQTHLKCTLPKLNTLTLFSLATVLAVIVKVTDGVPERVSEKVLIADSERKNKNQLSKQCNVSHRTELVSPQCVFGENNQTIKAIVVGDSHANTLINSVAESITDNNGGVVFMGANACHSLLDIKHDNFKNCFLYNNWVIDTIQSIQAYQGLPLIIINRAVDFKRYNKMTINGHRQGTENFKQVYSEQSQELICHIAKDRDVYITLPVPEMPVDVPVFMAKQYMLADSNEDVYISLTKYQTKHKEYIEGLQRLSKTCGVHLLDPTALLCSENRCNGSIEGKPLYHDENHLSEYGNDFLVPMFTPIWQKTISSK